MMKRKRAENMHRKGRKSAYRIQIVVLSDHLSTHSHCRQRSNGYKTGNYRLQLILASPLNQIQKRALSQEIRVIGARPIISESGHLSRKTGQST